jgi:hypothetical protein
MRELIEFIARSLVDDADSVRTQVVQRGAASVVELEVAQPALGKVIGRQGRTARAMRTLLSAAGEKSRRRYILDIID